MILLPRHRLTRQPQGAVEVDWNNPLTRGLVYAVNFGQGLAPQNLVNRRLGTPTVAGSVTVGAGTVGKCIVGAAGVLSLADPADALRITSGPVTHAGVVQISSIDSPWGGVFAVSDGSSNGVFALQRNSSTSGLVAFRDNTINAGFAAGSLTALATGLPTTWVCTSNDRASTSPHNLYIGGGTSYSANSSTTLGTVGGAGVSARFFGERSANTSFGSDGRYFAHFAWNRVLSAEEAREFNANPWQIFRAQQRRLYVQVGGGTSTRTVTAAGGFDLGGTSNLLRQVARAASGGIDLGGTAAQARVVARVPSGGFDLGGTAPALRYRVSTGSGGVAFGGTAPAVGFRGITVEGDGGIAIGGEVIPLRYRTVSADGGIALGGTAAVSFVGGAITARVIRVVIPGGGVRSYTI